MTSPRGPGGSPPPPPILSGDLPLVERDDELRRLVDALGPGFAGTSIVLSGPSGVGKSRLARSAGEGAARRGWRVLEGRAYPLEAGLSYGLVADAFVPFLATLGEGALESLSRGGGAELRRLFPSLEGEVDPAPLRVWSDPSEFKTRLFWTFTQLVRRVAEQQPLFVLLEDLQFAGESSLELLHFAARQLAGRPVRFACTWNDEITLDTSRVRDLTASLESLGLCIRISLEPLSREGTRALVRSAFEVDDAVSRDLAMRLHERTGGNPLFLEETLRSLVATGQLHRSEGVWLGWESTAVQPPPSVRDGILDRLWRVSPEGRAAAEVVAAAGGPVSHVLLVRMIGGEAAGRPPGLEELLASRMLSERMDGGRVVYDFPHPLFREVIYSDLGLARRGRLHVELARALEVLHGSETLDHAGEVAYHLVRSHSEARAGRARAYLERAGRDALRRHAEEEAGQYLEAALELEDGSPGVELLDLLAHARSRQGRYDEALRLWSEAIEGGGSPRRTAGILRSMGLACFWSGRHGDAIERFREALEAVGGDDAPLQASLLVATGVCLQEVGRPGEALAAIERALEMAHELESLPLIARAHRALALLHTWTGPPARAREHGRRAIAVAEEIGDDNVRFWGHWALAVTEGLTGDVEAMALHIDAAEKIAVRLQSPVLRIWTAELAVERAYARGDWETGIALGEQALALARSLNQRNLVTRLLVWTALIYLGKGQVERGRAMVDEAWSLAGCDGEADTTTASSPPGKQGSLDVHKAVPAHIGRAAYHLAVEELEDCVRVGEAGLAVAERSGYPIWAIHHLLPLLAEALIRAEDLEGAARVGERLRREATRLEHKLGLAWADACEALVISLRGNREAGVDLLRRAAEALEAVPMMPDAARLRRQLAARLAELGDRQAALSELRDVHERMARLGHRREQEKARAQFRELDARPPPRAPQDGVGALTGRELEVAQLVAEGASNKAIARALEVSTRTVTSHLANTYRKLGISSRHELARRVRTGDLE